MKVAWVLVAACASCAARPTPASSPTRSTAPIAVLDATAPVPDVAPPRTPCEVRDADAVCLRGGIAQLGRAAPESQFEERPPRAVRLHAFAIDREEVSAERYDACVRAQSCRSPHCDDGTEPERVGAVRCVAWPDARQFCSFAGGRLPSEAEWERAAAGLLPAHRTYPWGDALDGGTDAPGVDETVEGVVMLGGGVAEWIADVGAFYTLPPHTDAGLDAAAASTDTSERESADAAFELPADSGLVLVDEPHGPASGPWRIVRGGDEHTARTTWTTTRRRFRQPDDRRAWIGFRCAYASPTP